MVNYENTLTLHGSRDKKSPSHRWRGFLTSPIYTASVGTVCNTISKSLYRINCTVHPDPVGAVS